MMILFTLILVFIVVYLYYMIADVRKIQQDIKKLQDDAEGRKTSHENDIKQLTTVTQELQQQQALLSQQQNTMSMQYSQQGATTTAATMYYSQQDVYTTVAQNPTMDMNGYAAVVAPTMQEYGVDAVPVAVAVVSTVPPVHKTTTVNEDDIESVTTEDIRNTLDCDDEDDIEINVKQTVDQTSTPATVTQIEAGNHVKYETLKNMKYEELKEMCKAQGLCNKGSKEVLIKRLSAPEAVTDA